MLELVEPLAAVPDERNQRWVASQKKNRRNLMDFLGRADNMAGLAANVVTVATAISSGLILPALGTAMALKFLHSKYQRG